MKQNGKFLSLFFETVSHSDKSVLLRISRISLLSQSTFLQFPKDHLKFSENRMNARLKRKRGRVCAAYGSTGYKVVLIFNG